MTRIVALALLTVKVALACAECHRTQTAHFEQTPMARALEPASSCEILQKNRDLQFREGVYQTRITREGDGSILSVTDGSQSMTVPLRWAFGRGQAGQTYVFERNGALYESRVSFYNAIQKLDVTIGAHGTKPASFEEAAGRKMDAGDARDCFGCHSHGAVVQGKLHLETMSPGVGCGSCHLNAEEHAAAFHSGGGTVIKPAKLSKLDAEETSELCGRCHRTWSQIAMNGPRGVNNVRFQPYRLTNSKCYDASDARIGCTACHDPHERLVTEVSYYDAKCRACHANAGGKARTCKVAQKDCSSCHMPRIDLPGAHARFTDHQIRIVKAGASYPN